MRISSLRLENYKLFKDQVFNFKRITILAGANSSGKSTVLSAISAILQAKEDMLFPFYFPNFGENVQLGGYRDIVHGGNTRRKFGVEISFDDGVSLYGRFRYASSGNQILVDESRCRSSINNLELEWVDNEKGYRVKCDTNEEVWSEAFKKMSPIIVNFMGVINKFAEDNKSQRDEAEVQKVMRRMEQTASSWEFLKSKKISELVQELKYDALYGRHLSGIEASMRSMRKMFSYIGPVRAYPARHYSLQAFADRIDSRGANAYYLILEWHKYNQKKFSKLISDINFLKLADDINPEALKDDLIELKVKPFNHVESVNLSDVGFGIPQILPVLVANVGLPDGGTLLVNQPEVHLHPSSQAMLANYFCREIGKRSYVIETHSEYLINRLRVLVSKGDVSPDDISIIYIDSGVDGPAVHDIGLTKEGRLVGAPKSFFDTYYIDNKELILGAFNG